MWKNVNAIRSQSENIPAKSGIYCFTQYHLVCGLKLGRKLLYVGKAINLRNRFLQHLNLKNSPNSGLWSELIKFKDEVQIEFHFQEKETEQISSAEKNTITKLKPQHNIVYNRR